MFGIILRSILFSAYKRQKRRLAAHEQMAIVTCILWLLTNSVAAQYSAKITQIDRSGFPTMRVYVSIADANGNPIPDNLNVKLTLLEDGMPVSKPLIFSEGWTVSSVLVLDVSGSMNEEGGAKIQKAREAAIGYLDNAPQNYQIGVVCFSDTARVVSGFGTGQDTLRRRIANLTANGGTALHDGIALAFDMFRGRRDRKEIIVLTDGRENSSSFGSDNPYKGRQVLLQHAFRENCTISSIGLGSDADATYLRGYQQSGGWYLFSPSPNELHGIFQKASKLLEKEKVLEYVTMRPDGRRENLSVKLDVGNETTTSLPESFAKPGFFPHIADESDHYHSLLAALILGLLIVPGTVSVVNYFNAVRKFRASHLTRLVKGSPYIGKRDPNVGPGGRGFTEGDWVIVCPVSNTPHNVRSWRMNKCACMREPRGKGSYCYHQKLPHWVRSRLDYLSRGQTSERGRTWLCHCAGDKKGW